MWRLHRQRQDQSRCERVLRPKPLQRSPQVVLQTVASVCVCAAVKFVRSLTMPVRLLARVTVYLSVPIGASTDVLPSRAFEIGRGLKFENWEMQDIARLNA